MRRMVHKVTIKVTRQKDEYGEKMYKLYHHPRKSNGWSMPGITPKTTYSRDDLQSLGFTLEK